MLRVMSRTLDSVLAAHLVAQRRLGLLAVTLVAGVLLCSLFLLFHPAYTDDSYISLAYARTLMESGTWGMFPGHTANSATSPLNVILLGLVGKLVGSYTVGAAVLDAAALTLILYLGFGIGERLFHDRSFGVLACVGLALNPLLLSTIGLESPIYAALLVCALACLIAERWVWLGLSLGLLTLARPDGALFAVLVGLELLVVEVLILRRLRWSTFPWTTFAIAVLVVLPWVAFSWTHLGSLVSDTLLFKAGKNWGSYYFHNGPAVYLEVFPVATLASFAPVVLAAVAPFVLPARARPVAALLEVYAAAHYLAYTLLRVSPYHWYYLQQVVPIVLLGAMGLCALRQRLDPVAGRVVTGLALGIPAAVTGLLIAEIGVPLREPLINTNWATEAEYSQIAGAVLQSGEPIAVNGEIGTLAFYSNRFLVNGFTDLGAASEEISQRSLPRQGIPGALLRLNFLWRDLEGAHAPPTRLALEPPDSETAPEPPGTIMAWTTGTRWFPPRRLYLVDRQASSSSAQAPSVSAEDPARLVLPHGFAMGNTNLFGSAGE